MGGRLQLIRSTINDYLSYWLRAIAIPKGILNKITALTAKFFFHGNDQNKIHMIAWEKAALPASKGGMSLLFINQLNILSKAKSPGNALTRALYL